MFRLLTDFSARNKILTAKILQQGYRYNKLRKTFSKLYNRHHELVSTFKVGFKSLLQQGLSEPEFYGELVYKLTAGRTDFSDKFRKVTYVTNVLDIIAVIQQSACLIANAITAKKFDIVNFPFLDGDAPRSTSYDVYISPLIRFARVSSHVDDLNTRNKVLTAKILMRFQNFIGGILT